MSRRAPPRGRGHPGWAAGDGRRQAPGGAARPQRCDTPLRAVAPVWAAAFPPVAHVGEVARVTPRPRSPDRRHGPRRSPGHVPRSAGRARPGATASWCRAEPGSLAYIRPMHACVASSPWCGVLAPTPTRAAVRPTATPSGPVGSAPVPGGPGGGRRSSSAQCRSRRRRPGSCGGPHARVPEDLPCRQRRVLGGGQARGRHVCVHDPRADRVPAKSGSPTGRWPMRRAVASPYTYGGRSCIPATSIAAVTFSWASTRRGPASSPRVCAAAQPIFSRPGRACPAARRGARRADGPGVRASRRLWHGRRSS